MAYQSMYGVDQQAASGGRRRRARPKRRTSHVGEGGRGENAAAHGIIYSRVRQNHGYEQRKS